MKNEELKMIKEDKEIKRGQRSESVEERAALGGEERVNVCENILIIADGAVTASGTK